MLTVMEKYHIKISRLLLAVKFILQKVYISDRIIAVMPVEKKKKIVQASLKSKEIANMHNVGSLS
jgi:hypothetical protein